MVNPNKDKNKFAFSKLVLALTVIISTFTVVFHPNISVENKEKFDQATDIISKLWIVVEIFDVLE